MPVKKKSSGKKHTKIPVVHFNVSRFGRLKNVPRDGEVREVVEYQGRPAIKIGIRYLILKGGSIKTGQKVKISLKADQ